MSVMSVALMGHPKRQRFIDELIEQLPERTEVVLDRCNDRWETGRRSLLAFDPAATHHLVIQDDAVLGRDCIEAAALAASAAGERPVALYTGKARPHQGIVAPAVKHALRVGSPWISMGGPWWGVAIVLPTAHIPGVVEWGDKHPKIKNYDLRIARWYQGQGIDCWYTVPSLVDHREVAENPSLISGRTGNRQAHCFIGERSALEIDWSRPPDKREGLFRHATNGRERRAVRGTARYRNLTANPNWIEVSDGAVPTTA